MEQQELVEEILKSKKYSDVSRGIVERLCNESLKKYKKKKDIIRETKKQLHIIYGSFLTNNCNKVAKKMVLDYSGESMILDKDFSLELLELHTSTKERLNNIYEIYGFLSRYIKKNMVVSDVGCGFNPFAIPFMNEKPSTYYAYEISEELVDLLNVYFKSNSLDNYVASVLDGVKDDIPNHSDLLIALKILPVLQHQKKGRAIELLAKTSFDIAIVSFPIASLSGKNKGMESFYSSFIEDNLPQNISIIERRKFDNELFYVLNKNNKGE